MGRGRTRWWLRPPAVAAILTVVCLPLGPTVPGSGLEGSWQLGLSLVHLRDVAAGSGWIFTYGPLGFLERPNIVWLPGAILGLVYVVAVTFALYFLVCRGLAEWLAPIAAVALTVVFALVTVQVNHNLAELASTVLILWSLTLIRPDRLETALPIWIPPLLGGAAALQLLVKFGSGGVALGGALVVTVARPPRRKNVALLAASFPASLLALWLVAQQPPGDIAEWLRRSVQLSSGYSSAMAFLAGFEGGRYWRLWLVVAGVLVFGCRQLLAKYRARAIPSVALLTLAVWFFTKEGFVRLDFLHVRVAVLCLGALIAAIPWERRWIPVGLVGLAFAFWTVVTAVGGVALSSQLRAVVAQPRYGRAEAERIIRSTLQPSFRSGELNTARRSIEAFDAIPHKLVAGLRNADVHMDPWEIAAVWAYHLRWRPVPAFQAYFAYTRSLDQLNADSLRSSNGPDVVIRRQGPYPSLLLGRVPAWESPNYMVTLTCSYEVTVDTLRWQTLRRTSNACGRPRSTSKEVLRDGESVRVPRARNRDDIVVATFAYPTSALERVATLVFKPSRLPDVTVSGLKSELIAGTASQFHLLYVPQTIGTRHITNAGLDIRSLSFPNAEGAVTVRYYELSTG